MYLAWVTLSVLAIVVAIMPKKLSALELYSTSFFALCLAVVGDTYLSLIKHLYGYFEKGPQPMSLLFSLVTYPAVNMIFLNFYQYLNRFGYKLLYIVGWWIFAMSYEFLALRMGLFYYSGWKWWYSALIYPMLYLILLLNLQLVRFMAARPSRR
jgi:hypothetical protein